MPFAWPWFQEGLNTRDVCVCVCVTEVSFFFSLKTISSKIPLCRTTAVMWGPNPIFFPPPFFFSIPGDCEVPLFKVGHASKFWERATTMSALLSSFHLLWLWTAISSIWTPVILTFKVSFSRSRHFLWTLSTHIYLSLLVCLPGYDKIKEWASPRHQTAAFFKWLRKHFYFFLQSRYDNPKFLIHQNM